MHILAGLEYMIHGHINPNKPYQNRTIIIMSHTDIYRFINPLVLLLSQTAIKILLLVRRVMFYKG